MGKLILVPLDEQKVSRDMIRLAQERSQHMGAMVRFLYVLREEFRDREAIEEAMILNFNHLIQNQGMTEDRYEFVIGYGQPSRVIQDMAFVIHADLIMMAAHNHTILDRLFLGSNTDFVLHHATCPIYVHKSSGQPLEPKIVVPIDFTDISLPLLQQADVLAQDYRAELHVVHVADYTEFSEAYVAAGTGLYHTGDAAYFRELDATERADIRERDSQKLEALIAEVQLKSPAFARIFFGRPYEGILELQKELKAMMIVVGAHSHSVMHRLFIGSTTDYLAHHAACDLFVVK